MRRLFDNKKNKVNNKMKKITSGMLAASLVFGMIGCGTDKKPSDVNDVPDGKKYESENLIKDLEFHMDPPKKIDDSVNESVIGFSINLFKTSTLNDLSADKNAMVSPESVLLALGMTANGAAGETLSEMENVLCKGHSVSELNEYSYALADAQNGNEDVKFNIANSIWIKSVDESLSVNNEFLENDKKYYNADAFKSAFDEKTVEEINNWVDENTNGMIKKVLDNIPPQTVMYLINAVAFEGKWLAEYTDEDIREEYEFNNSDASTSKVNMMFSEEKHYMHDDKAKAFIKPYEGNRYGFMAILPNEGVELKDYISGMTEESYMNLFNSKDESVDVNAGIPEFSADYDILMNDALKAMGMPSAFDDSNADFSKMANSSDGNLFIGNVIHKTHIEVDRNGTKAAAITVVQVDKECAMEVVDDIQSIILDRPYLYAIVDMETGMPIFMGAVNTMK